MWRIYQTVYGTMFGVSPPHQQYCEAGETETVVGLLAPEFLLMAVFSPLVTAPEATLHCTSLLRWVRHRERQLLWSAWPTWAT